jgi:CubicO group peptidase (beta-lactamase class C family)
MNETSAFFSEMKGATYLLSAGVAVACAAFVLYNDRRRRKVNGCSDATSAEPAVEEDGLEGLSRVRLERIRQYVKEQVARGKAPMMSVVVARRGRVVFEACAGKADVERGTPLRRDTIFRIFSMTKPIVSAAAMILLERAQIMLDDPVEKYLACFEGERQVYANGKVETAKTKITLRHLLTHTSGLTYDFFPGEVGKLYKAARIDFVPSKVVLSGGAAGNADDPGMRDLAPGALLRAVERLAGLPLVCHPGEAFNYSVGLDVIGCVIEHVTQKRLADFLHDELFVPLGMRDTGFHVRKEDAHRLAACYRLVGSASTPQGFQLADDPVDSNFLIPREHLCSGGGGLCSTVHDYLRFTLMLAGKGACPSTAPGGPSERILSRASVEFMMSNHLPDGVFVPSGFLHARGRVGFGIGGSVTTCAASNALPGKAFAWGGIANTFMSINTEEGLSFLCFSQVVPSFELCQWRRDLHALVHACIDD